VGAILPLTIPLPAGGATQYWKVASGSWNAPANWSTAVTLNTAGAVPAGGDTANAWNNDATNRTITLNANVAAPLAALNLANVGGGTTTFAQGNFNLATVDLSVGGRGNGNNARAAYTQTGGTTTASGFLAVGDVIGSTGSYTMSGGAVNVGGTMFVGYRGAGVFNQTAGTTTVAGGLQVANTTSGSSGAVTVGANATLNVAGTAILGGSVPGSAFGPASLTVQGKVTVDTLNIQQSGTLNLAPGGTLTVNSDFFRMPPNSTFNWTGGTLNVPRVTISRAYDTTQFGPFYGVHQIDHNVTLNVADTLGIGNVAGNTGTLTQNAGTITVGTPTDPGEVNVGLYRTSGGTYTLANAAALTLHGALYLNLGTVSVNGGTMTIGGLASTDTGRLNVNGGSLAITTNYNAFGPAGQTGGTLTVAGGTFVTATTTQSGGVATHTGAITVNGGGRIELSGTAKRTVDGKVTIGLGTAGTLSISGGEMKVNNALESAHPGASINVSGGSLGATRLNAGGPITQSGGTINVGTIENRGQFNLSGGTATVTNEIDLYNAMHVSGTGALHVNGNVFLGGNSTSVGGSGPLTVSGGTVTATGGLGAFNSPVTLSGGVLTVGSLQVNNTSSYTQSGGTLNTASIFAGNARGFAFTGGTVNLSNGPSTLVSSGLTVGDGTKAATLNLQDATVNNGRVTLPSAASALTGTGTVSAGVASNGVVAPGTPGAAGTLTLGGTSTFGPSAVTRMKLVTGTAGDRISAGAVTLGGTLELSTGGFGFAPPLYSSQRLITATSVAGRFDRLAGNLNPMGRRLAVTYDAVGVLVTVALAGDADLNRTVDFTDLVALAQHYDLPTGQTWGTGDFDGSGGVDFSDLVLLAQSYDQSVPAGGALPAAVVADWAVAQALVPEPAAVGALALGAAATPLLRRGRRHV
jgi:hypothetical protein